MPKRTAYILAFVSLTIILIIEFSLRKIWGLGDTLLFRADKDFEYIAQPNQTKFRFGNRIVYNEYSMRSYPLSPDDDCIVLGLGDSVINGGSLTDQDSLATSIVENELRGIRFLNISAGSWGPDNCAAYLKKYGSFNAKLMILFVSSHDAYDNMTFENIVGHHESYPDNQYALASFELLMRYALPGMIGPLTDNSEARQLVINKNGEDFNPGFEFIKNYTKTLNIPLIICLHAEEAEMNENKYNSQGEEIIRFCKKNNVKLISGLEVGENLSHMRDQIHLNSKGQKLWANVLLKEIKETLSTCL